MLEVKNLSKIYDDGTIALSNVSFEVEKNDFLVIIGLSGSGKSTLLRCINRLIEPTSGTITWNNIEISSLKGKELRRIRSRIGMIFQHFNLVKRISVLNNVLSGALWRTKTWQAIFYKFSKKEKEKAIDSLKKVGIDNQSLKRADQLSGGQQQRAAIARALMQNPVMIIADEPVASLDPVLAHSILGYLEKINKEENITVICSLHYFDLVKRYATKVLGLKDGKIVYKGSSEDIKKITDEEFKKIYGNDAQLTDNIKYKTEDQA